MTDRTTPTLGTILTEPVGRDAIHIAVAPVVARNQLWPGDNIGLVDDGNTELVDSFDAGRCAIPLGIVDPFLKQSIKPGQRFWMWLYPQSITGLRHVWTHPDFRAKVPGGQP